MAPLPDWTGGRCVIVASGPSAASVDLALSRGRARHIAVNTSFRLCPWADILFAADLGWWRAHHEEAAAFAGIKVSRADVSSFAPEVIRFRPEQETLFGFATAPGSIAVHLNNSGAIAINVALQLGVTKIVLVGFDMSGHAGKHWHGSHPSGLSDPTDDLLARWAHHLDASAPSLADFGAAMVNASLESALQAYPKMPFPEAVEWLMTPAAGSSTRNTSAPT